MAVSGEATRDPLAQVPDDAIRIPENHPADSRTYPPGSRIVGGVLELPPSGLGEGDKKNEALAAADARREGRPFVSETGINLGKDVPVGSDFGLAAAIRDEREEKGEQIVNAKTEESQNQKAEMVFTDVSAFVKSLPPAMRDQLRKHFAAEIVQKLVNGEN